jgi:hypothetical protein
MGKTHFATNVL